MANADWQLYLGGKVSRSVEREIGGGEIEEEEVDRLGNTGNLDGIYLVNKWASSRPQVRAVVGSNSLQEYEQEQ